jgi:predicted nucleic acid-binding protein
MPGTGDFKVIDSSAWIEWLTDSPTAAALEPFWPDQQQIIVPTLVQLELAKWYGRERTGKELNQVLAYTSTCLVLPLDTRLALRAAELCRTHRLSTADSVVYAAALENGATLLTCDAHFEGLESVEFVVKQSG